MAKKKTRHAESRALKKEAEKMSTFFRSDVKVYLHPFWDRRLEKLLDKLLKMNPSELPYDIAINHSLVDVFPETLGYEELLVLDSILLDVSKLNIVLSYDRMRIRRSVDWKWFFEELRTRAIDLWLDEEYTYLSSAKAEMDIRYEKILNFPEIQIPLGKVIMNAIRFWRSRSEAEWQPNLKGKPEFVKFLVILIQCMIFRPKNVKIDYWNDLTPYEYIINQTEINRFLTRFPRAVDGYEHYMEDPFQVLPEVHYTLALIALKKFLDDERHWKCERVVFITSTRPAERFQVTLRNFCESCWLRLESRWFPEEPIDLNFDTRSVFLIEDNLVNYLFEYAEFWNAFVIPLSGFMKSHQQKWK